MKNSNNNEIALMFSGGVDSTLTAIKLAEQFNKVHLLTYSNGYGHTNFSKAGKRCRELNNIIGNKFCHSLISIRDAFEKYILLNWLEEFRKYKSGFIWCMGCKIIMHMQTILYAKRHNINYSADGSSGATGEMVEQMLVSVSLIKYFYEHNGIEYTVPVYDMDREVSISKLKKLGFNMGIRILDRHLGIQPRCIPGEIYYMPYLLFNKPPSHDELNVALYIKEIIKKVQVKIDSNE